MRNRTVNGRNYIKKDCHNFVSDISGFKFKSDSAVYGFDPEKGLLMDISEQGEYNPQLHIRPVQDRRNVPDVRLEQEYNFSPPPSPSDL